MMHAGQDATFAECRNWLLENIEKFEHYTKEDVESIPEDICNSATISTLHGCPPHEIESIANYLLTEKHINTFVKCNPTLLGYEFARKTMDEMGYDYMMFGDFHFKDDLQYADAVPMFTRLMKLSEDLGLSFGVKITNTFPVDVTREELPSEEMYMSGKALFPLSISLAAKLAKEFDGRLRIRLFRRRGLLQYIQDRRSRHLACDSGYHPLKTGRIQPQCADGKTAGRRRPEAVCGN